MILTLLAAAALAADAPDSSAIFAAHADLAGRVDAVSAHFLGTPYKLGPLGEGEAGEYDRDPLVRFDQFDCTTFVEEVAAFSLEPDFASAEELLKKIRYKDGVVSYETRNHFPETDWIPNNMAAGLLSDVTAKVAGRRMKWVFKTIRKNEWYLAKSTSDLEGFSAESEESKAARIEKWRAAGAEFKDESARLPYLPLEDLPALAAKIPDGTIGNVVREALPEKPIVVTHQVLIFQRPGGPIIRHAAYGKQVQDEPLLGYFAKFKDAKWRVLGLNLNAINPGPKTP
ncbi:MAG: DUF1460 domain-containing protein [Elusimicrobia bacterium]|nr:DUF1460 domain-containing protein [Elusimicrobiota bacterium]